MEKLKNLIFWITVVIAILALAISIHNFVRINNNFNIIKIIGETQSYILELI
ncbi:hypothetical protein ES708_02897 [subsurface metagenome]|jgi:uncharacterized membrane protein